MAEGPRARASCLKRLGCCAGALLLIAGILTGIAWVVLVRMYGIRDDVGWIDSDRKKLPPHTTPVATPGNAYDGFVEATALLSEPVEPVEPIGTVQPDWLTAVYHNRRPYIDAQLPAVRDIVERNGATLAKIHEAAARPIWAVPSDDSIDIDRKLRALARLSNNAALFAHVQGDDAEALTHVEDCLVLSVACEQRDNAGAFMVGRAAGGIGAMIGRYVLTQRNLSPGRLREHAALVRDLRGRLVPVSEVVTRWARNALSFYDKVEAATTHDAAEMMYPPRMYLAAYGREAPTAERLDERLHVMIARRDLARSRAWAEDRYARYLDELSKPLWLADPESMDGRKEADIAARNDLWAHTIVNDLAYQAHTYQQYQATLLAEEVIASIEAYRGEHGAYPADLARLVPEYMPEMPIDPWTGKPMLYARVPEGYKLYAAGPNKRDDGGWMNGNALKGPDHVFVPVQIGTWDPNLPEVPPAPLAVESQPSDDSGGPQNAKSG